MKLTYAEYVHNAIGFPGVQLKIKTEGSLQKITSCYLVVDKLIRGEWSLKGKYGIPVETIDSPEMEQALEHFDKWTRLEHADNPVVQG